MESMMRRMTNAELKKEKKASETVGISGIMLGRHFQEWIRALLPVDSTSRREDIKP